jgi:hypothetical protein
LAVWRFDDLTIGCVKGISVVDNTEGVKCE